jgi:hypothetical protein
MNILKSNLILILNNQKGKNSGKLFGGYAFPSGTITALAAAFPTTSAAVIVRVQHHHRMKFTYIIGNAEYILHQLGYIPLTF